MLCVVLDGDEHDMAAAAAVPPQPPPTLFTIINIVTGCENLLETAENSGDE